MGLIVFAAKLWQYQEDDRRAKENRRAAEVREFEEAQRRSIERKRFDDLMAASTRWNQSQMLREYLEAAKRKYLDQHSVLEPGSEMAQWLNWASRQADCLDPLTDSPPALLDEGV
jgi:hypothetical protein